MRQFVTSLLSALILSVFLSGCATPNQAETICTAEWISARADTAVTRIETRTRRSMKTLANAAEGWTQGKAPGPFQMLALSSSLRALEKELKNGRGMKDLRLLARTCDDPEIIGDALSGFMRDKGLPERIVGFIENTETYRDLLTLDTETRPQS